MKRIFSIDQRSLTIACLLIYSTQVMAINYYVSNQGSNGHSGLSIEQAFKTIQYPVGFLQPGDTIFVADGNYAGFRVAASGTATAPVVFKALGAAVVIDQPTLTTEDNGILLQNGGGASTEWIVIDGFILRNLPRHGIRAVNIKYCVLRNNECYDQLFDGIQLGFSENVVIEYNTVHHQRVGINLGDQHLNPVIRGNRCYANDQAGIQMDGDAYLISNAKLEQNILYDNNHQASAAINMRDVEQALLINNLLYNNWRNAIAVNNCLHTHIYNNTIVNPIDSKWCILLCNQSEGARVYNNILVNLDPEKGSIGISPELEGNLQSDYNLLVNRMSFNWDEQTISLADWRASGLDENSPSLGSLFFLFEDWINQDFCLKPNAPAVDAGTNTVLSELSNDLFGAPRPFGAAVDIGCCESISTTSTTERLSKDHSLGLVDDRLLVRNAHAGDWIYLFDLNGRLCFQAQLAATSEMTTLNISKLAPGVYAGQIFNQYHSKIKSSLLLKH